MEKTGLPSRQFLIRGGIAIGIVTIILLVQTNWFQGLFGRKGTLTADNLTVGDVVGQDSNGNGIPDWEERLWGLDPTVLYTGEMSNREIIENKKKALGFTATDNPNLTETDRLARQLFSLTTAIGQTEGADSDAIAAAAGDLGASVDIKSVSDKYSVKDLRTVPTTLTSLRSYQKSLSAVVSKQDSNTADIEVVIHALETGDFSQLSTLNNSSIVYKQMAKELSTMSVPIGAAQDHLDMMNGFYGTAISFDYLAKLDEDGISGLSGISIYKEYSLRLDQALLNINQYFSEYGIL